MFRPFACGRKLPPPQIVFGTLSQSHGNHQPRRGSTSWDVAEAYRDPAIGAVQKVSSLESGLRFRVSNES